MASFDWITRQWSILSDVAGNSKSVGREEFLRRSGGINEKSDWLSLAQDWGRKQSPAITVEYRKDVSAVILSKRAQQREDGGGSWMTHPTDIWTLNIKGRNYGHTVGNVRAQATGTKLPAGLRLSKAIRKLQGNGFRVVD